MDASEDYSEHRMRQVVVIESRHNNMRPLVCMSAEKLGAESLDKPPMIETLSLRLACSITLSTECSI